MKIQWFDPDLLKHSVFALVFQGKKLSAMSGMMEREKKVDSEARFTNQRNRIFEIGTKKDRLIQIRDVKQPNKK